MNKGAASIPTTVSSEGSAWGCASHVGGRMFPRHHQHHCGLLWRKIGHRFAKLSSSLWDRELFTGWKLFPGGLGAEHREKTWH